MSKDKEERLRGLSFLEYSSTYSDSFSTTFLIKGTKFGFCVSFGNVCWVEVDESERMCWKLKVEEKIDSLKEIVDEEVLNQILFNIDLFR